MNRTLFFLAIMIFLGGCSPDRASDLAACRTEADKFYQGYQADDVNNPRSRYIISCMAAKGYEFDISPTDCDSRHSLPVQSTCYASPSWLARIIDRLPGH